MNTHTNMNDEIERRPLIYYRISVISDMYGRHEYTTPVAMWCDDADEAIDTYKLQNGETIINTIPAQPGSYEVGIWDEPDNGWVVLGYEIPGMPETNWVLKAASMLKRKHEAKSFAGEIKPSSKVDGGV